MHQQYGELQTGAAVTKARRGRRPRAEPIADTRKDRIQTRASSAAVIQQPNNNAFANQYSMTRQSTVPRCNNRNTVQNLPMLLAPTTSSYYNVPKPPVPLQNQPAQQIVTAPVEYALPKQVKKTQTHLTGTEMELIKLLRSKGITQVSQLKSIFAEIDRGKKVSEGKSETKKMPIREETYNQIVEYSNFNKNKMLDYFNNLAKKRQQNATISQQHIATISQQHTATISQQHTAMIPQQQTAMISQQQTAMIQQQQTSMIAQQQTSIIAQQQTAMIAQQQTTMIAQQQTQSIKNQNMYNQVVANQSFSQDYLQSSTEKPNIAQCSPETHQEISSISPDRSIIKSRTPNQQQVPAFLNQNFPVHPISTLVNFHNNARNSNTASHHQVQNFSSQLMQPVGPFGFNFNQYGMPQYFQNRTSYKTSRWPRPT